MVSLLLICAGHGAATLKTCLTAWLMMCQAEPNLRPVPSPRKAQSRNKCNPTIHRERQRPKLSSLEKQRWKKPSFSLSCLVCSRAWHGRRAVCASPVAAGWTLGMHRALITALRAVLVLPSLCRRFRAVVVSVAAFSRPSSSTGCAQLAAEGTFSDFGTCIASHCCISSLPSGCHVSGLPKESNHQPGL